MGILGRSGTRKESKVSAGFDSGSFTERRVGERKTQRRVIPYPEHPARITPRYTRDLVGSIVDGTCPVLLDREEARIALDVTPGVLDDMVRDGRLEDYVVVGNRQLFRSAQIRDLILDARREIAERVATRDVAAAVAAREQERERRREMGRRQMLGDRAAAE